MMDEVMVVAYGTAKRSAFTGSASVVMLRNFLKDRQRTSFRHLLDKWQAYK